MSTRNTIFPFIVLSLTCFVNQNVLAGTIYQWTDEAGNVNFSDVPPDDSITAESHEYNINQDRSYNNELDQYSIINQAEQMAQWRRQLAEERRADKQLYLEERRLDQELELSRQNEIIAAEGVDTSNAPAIYDPSQKTVTHRYNPETGKVEPI